MSISNELFQKWRSPRFGKTNPENLTNPVWESLVRSRVSADQFNEDFDGPSSLEEGPAWCFSRFGQTTTVLPDGTKVLVAGEHEDYYDSDFYIYNDVVVQKPDDSIEIYGYPNSEFPPTDFHTATLIGERIVLVGNLGYSAQRQPGVTQVLELRLPEFSVSSLGSVGSPPGWIHEHAAELSADGESIFVRDGLLLLNDELIENTEEWRLSLKDRTWERLTDRRWPQWVFRRRDRKWTNINEFRYALWMQQAGLTEVDLLDSVEAMLTKAGVEDLDSVARSMKSMKPTQPSHLGLIEQLYRPNLEHRALPTSEDEYDVYRIEIEGVPVRYVETRRVVRVVVEGALPRATLETMKKDLLGKLERLENTQWEIVEFG